MQSQIQEIRSRAILSDFIKKDVKLTPKGKEFLGNCPFHNEKTPSFTVNDDKGFYHCFGCGAHGDVFTYIMERSGISFIDALKEVALNVGVKIEQFKERHHIHSNLLEEVAIDYHKQLNSCQEALEYLEKRSISKESIEKFQIGVSSIPLKKQGLKELGLINDYGKEFFVNRIMFPIKNDIGQVVGFGGRIFKNNDLSDKNLPKYLNSKENEEFQKKKILYAYDVAKKEATVQNPFIVVEGYLDVIALHQRGLKTAIATLGTSLSEFHLELLWKRKGVPIFCFDGDFAGLKASKRTLDIVMPFLEPEKTISFLMLQNNSDPFDIVSERGQEFFKELLSTSIPCFEFFFKASGIMDAKTPEEKAKIKNESLKKIALIKDKDVQKYYREGFFEKLRKKSKTYSKVADQRKSFLNIKKDTCEKILLLTIQNHPELKEDMYPYLENVTFKNPVFEKIKDDVLMGNVTETIQEDEFLYKIAPFAKSSFLKEDVLKGWLEVFSSAFEKDAFKKQVEDSAYQMKNSFDIESWKRLKALKTYN